MSDDPARWQPDPTGRHDHRYWDGTQWTDDVADAGVASKDPYEAVSPDAPTLVTAVPADDTATYPTAPYPSAGPPPYAPPPPYEPPPPSAAGGPAGGGPGQRGLLIGGAILAAVALLVAAIVAFAGDDDEPTAPLADESPETTADEGDGGDGSADGDADGDADTNGLPEDLGDVDDFEGVEEALADAYEDMGLTEEQAECLTEELSELVEDGDFTEEQAMSQVFNLFAECDIAMEDFTSPPRG